MNQDFKKILSFIFLALAIVLSREIFNSFSTVLSEREDAARYNKENVRLAEIGEKIGRSLSFTQKNPEIVAKFGIILPESDSKPNFISSIESTASLSGIIIKKISFQKPDNSAVTGAAGETGTASDYKMQAADINFTGGYSALKNFLAAIENSLEIADVVHIDFKSAESGGSAPRAYDFNIKLLTYWQAPENEEKISAFLDTGNFNGFGFTKGKQFTDLVSPSGYNIMLDKASELNNPAPF